MATRRSNLPSSEDVALARLGGQVLAAALAHNAPTQVIALTDVKGEVHTVKLPTNALHLLVDALHEIAQGKGIALVPLNTELTTQEAANLLNVSVPTFINLLDDGDIPFEKSGNQRKVRAADLRVYKEKLEQSRLAALQRLSELDQALGLGYQ